MLIKKGAIPRWWGTFIIHPIVMSSTSCGAIQKKFKKKHTHTNIFCPIVTSYLRHNHVGEAITIDRFSIRCTKVNRHNHLHCGILITIIKPNPISNFEHISSNIVIIVLLTSRKIVLVLKQKSVEKFRLLNYWNQTIQSDLWTNQTIQSDLRTSQTTLLNIPWRIL